MASISKRILAGGHLSWDVTIRVRGYPTRCKSFRTKTEAAVWAATTEAAAKGRTLAISDRATFNDLVAEAKPRLRSPYAAAIEYWTKHFGSLRCRDIAPAMIARHRDLLLGAPTRSHGHRSTKPRTARTVQAYLQQLAAILNVGVTELRWLERNPSADVASPSFNNERTRFLSDEERQALLAACRGSASPLLYPYVLFALTCGCRRGDADGLLWRNVDLARRWVVFPRTKNGTARGAPLTEEVAALFATLPRTSERVFPVDLNTAWKTALARAGITDFRFHDVRHTCGSVLAQEGASLIEIATLLGHKDIRMTQRYAHLASQHTRALVDRTWGGIK